MRALACRVVRSSVTAFLSSTLFACGGSGGGAGTVSSGTAPPPVQTPPPSADTPLQLTSSNTSTATTLAFGNGALALTMGQLAVDWTALAEASDTLSFNKTCPGGGSASARLADRDGDRHAGAGDQLTVSLAGCYLKELDDMMDGSVTITLTSPSAGQQRAGILSFAGFKARATNPGTEMLGALHFDYSASRLSKLVHVASDAQPFSLRFTDSTHSSTETVTALDAQHETRLDTVRATTTMRFHLSSNLLGGSLDATTAVSWGAWFDTYPDAGELSLAGANNSRAALRARSAQFTAADILLNGTVIDNLPLEGLGILWTGAPWLPQVVAADKYTVEIASSNSFRSLIQPDPALFLPNGALTWLYSRPLDPSSITGATFIQASGAPNTAFTPVPAKVAVEGGLLMIAPSTQLLPGARYELQLSLNGAGSVLRDTAGDTLPWPSFAGTVRQTVSASLVAGGPALLLGSSGTLVLDSSASSANGAAVASTRWRQLSGPPLAFSNAGAARTTVSPAGTGNGTAVVELEVANAAGDVDRRTFSLTVAADLGQAMVLAYRSGTGPFTVAANFDPAVSGAYANAFQSNTVLDVVLGNLRFLAGLSGGLTWQAGLKLSYGSGNASGVTGPGWAGCAGANNTGSLSVLDYALDASGKLDRLALDFDDSCGTMVTQGSIRYHSALPVLQ